MGEITKNEFLELLEEFSGKTLDPKFKNIDSWFEKFDGRFEKIDQRFKKIDEQFAEINSQFKKVDKRFENIGSQFVEFKKEIIHGFHVISEGVISNVQLVAEGVVNLHEQIGETNKRIEDTRQEVLAAVKFSYAELDRRITTLETEMKDLKTRMDKIERRAVS
jgi:archaellum component FlaC